MTLFAVVLSFLNHVPIKYVLIRLNILMNSVFTIISIPFCQDIEFFKHCYKASTVAASQLQGLWFHREVSLLSPRVHVGSLCALWFTPTSQNMPVDGFSRLNTPLDVNNKCVHA